MNNVDICLKMDETACFVTAIHRCSQNINSYSIPNGASDVVMRIHQFVF